MLYHVKPEYLDLWGEEVMPDTFITEAEIARLSKEWDVPVGILMSQLEEAGRGYVVNLSGVVIDYDEAVGHMDDEIRAKLHEEMSPCGEQEFFTAYEKAHAEKYGEEWELSKPNPVW